MATRTIGDILGCVVNSIGYQGPAVTLWVVPLVTQNGIAIYGSVPQPVSVPLMANAGIFTIPGGLSFALNPSVALNQIHPALADGEVFVSLTQNMATPFPFSMPGVYTLQNPVQASFAPFNLQEFAAGPSFQNAQGSFAPVLFTWTRAAGWPAGSPEFLDLSSTGTFNNLGQDFVSMSTAPGASGGLPVAVNGSVVSSQSALNLGAGVQYWWRVSTQVNGVFSFSNIVSFVTPAVVANQQPTVLSISATFS